MFPVQSTRIPPADVEAAVLVQARRARAAGFAIVLLLFSAAFRVEAADVSKAFAPDKLTEIDAAISLAISDGKCPGGVLWIERHGAAYHKAFGEREVEPQREAMTEDTIFDMASLTKVIATTTAVMRLVEQGKVAIDTPVSQYLPEFRGAGKEAITIRQLMTHTSGLRAGLAGGAWTGVEAAFARACAEPLPDLPGTVLRYSDINYIVLGVLVGKMSGRPLDQYCAEEIFGPLQMTETMFLPPEKLTPRIAPTTLDVPRGVVHDPTSRRMGGVAGHAGLFSTAADLARFARMLLGQGTLDGVRILAPETVALMTSVQTPASISGRRGLGWDIDSPHSGPRGKWFPLGSFGHTGWTGTSVWMDPFSETFVIFLSNRNHPTEAGNVLALRRNIATLAAESVRDFNFLHVPGALPWQPGGAFDEAPEQRAPHGTGRVLTGIDVLERDHFAALRGLKVGLITNQTGVDRQRHATIDLLHKAPEVQLVALFSPEHGLRGVVDEKVPDSRDERSGLPIYSLYGANRAPTAEQLAGLDALVFDIADVGCRFYTYTSTLGECLVAAGRADKKFFVLDRPNVISGLRVEGPMLTAERSFTAWHELPVRHGMTLGELAGMFAAERAPGVKLTVVECEGWKRGMWFDETGLPWVDPSPNMRSLTAAMLYPGVGLLEFCNVSVGRGTDRPFEFFGAPYIKEHELAEAIDAAGLPGLRTVPIHFTPRTSVFAGKECNGVQFLVTDRDAFSPLDLGIVLATSLRRLYNNESKIERIEKLLGDPESLAAIQAGESLAAVEQRWTAGREKFREVRERYLIYR